MSMMDFRGPSWVGDIYQKFEAMCMEVEETICEDAVKFVESQVHNVGSNMKKFYSDVMQDLASPDSIAHVKQPVPDLPLDSHVDLKIDENKKTSSKEDSNKVVNLFTNDKVSDQEDGDQVSSPDEHVKHRVNSCSRGSIKGLFSMQETKVEQHKDTTICCKKVPEKDCCRKTTSNNQVLENQDEASLMSKIIHEHAATEHMVLASPQAAVEVVGWEWDAREEEKEMGSCEGVDVDDYTVHGQLSTDVLSSQTIDEVLAQNSLETVWSKILHEHAATEHMVLASPHAAVEVVGWEWDAREEEKEMVSCEGVDVDDFTVHGQLSADVLSSQTIDEVLAQNSIETVWSKILHEHAATEHTVLASPQAAVEVVGWEWDAREEEKEMGSCEGVDVDDFTVHGQLSTDVLSSQTIDEVLAQNSLETDWSKILHEHAATEHVVLASPQAAVEVVGWEWDAREEEKEMGSCEGVDVDDFTVHGQLSTDVLSSQTIGEVLAQNSLETVWSKILHEHAATEHMVLASPQDPVEVVGWEWDAREEEKEMGSCEGVDVDDFTVHGQLSTDVLSSQTIDEVLAQISLETDSSVELNAIGDSETCLSNGELVSLSDSGKKDAGNLDVTENNDNKDIKVDTTDEDEIKLEETCVFVNENNVSFASYKEGKPWSYKRKMREAFSLKKKSSRRQEYKKLVTQYENANASSSLTCVDKATHTVFPELNTADLQTREFYESDWELL